MRAVMGMPAKYTSQEIQEILALHEHGYTATDIGATTGRDRNTIARVLQEQGVTLKTGAGWRQRKLDPTREIELVRLYEAGVSVPTLVERFDVGRTFIYALLRKYEVVTRVDQERARQASAPRPATRPERVTTDPLTLKTYAIRDRNRQYIWDYYCAHPCVDCGEADPVVLEADHVRGVKLGGLSQLAHQGRSLSVIDAEIAKCEVVCANCHRRRTAKSQGWYCGIVASSAA